MKRLINSYPTLFGTVIGLLIAGTILVIVIWLPGLTDAWDRHNSLVRSIWCTAALFGVCIGRLWRWRRRWTLWVPLSIFLILHVVGISLYSMHVQPISLGQWIILIVLESFVFFFGVDWSVRRFGHLENHGSPRVGSADPR